MSAAVKNNPKPIQADVAEAIAARREYSAGFVTDIASDTVPPGLSEDVIRLISARKNEPQWLLEGRLKDYRNWLALTPPAPARASSWLATIFMNWSAATPPYSSGNPRPNSPISAALR